MPDQTDPDAGTYIAKYRDLWEPRSWDYFPRTTEQRLGYLAEEMGEVLAALGKSQRWGLPSYNPKLPPAKQETNAAWLRRELADLKVAIALVEDFL